MQKGKRGELATDTPFFTLGTRTTPTSSGKGGRVGPDSPEASMSLGPQVAR